MKNSLTSLLTLVIMLIGLAMIVGGPRAVDFIFAPFVAVIRRAVQLLFVGLVILIIAAAALTARRSTPHQTQQAVELALPTEQHNERRE